ncbi:MAG: hypothetical protein Kow0074_05710 [Candidatus Zixiibacteriota bacterium]
MTNIPSDILASMILFGGVPDYGAGLPATAYGGVNSTFAEALATLIGDKPQPVEFAFLNDEELATLQHLIGEPATSDPTADETDAEALLADVIGVGQIPQPASVAPEALIPESVASESPNVPAGTILERSPAGTENATAHPYAPTRAILQGTATTTENTIAEVEVTQVPTRIPDELPEDSTQPVVDSHRKTGTPINRDLGTIHTDPIEASSPKAHVSTGGKPVSEADNIALLSATLTRRQSAQTGETDRSLHEEAATTTSAKGGSKTHTVPVESAATITTRIESEAVMVRGQSGSKSVLHHSNISTTENLTTPSISAMTNADPDMAVTIEYTSPERATSTVLHKRRQSSEPIIQTGQHTPVATQSHLGIRFVADPAVQSDKHTHEVPLNSKATPAGPVAAVPRPVKRGAVPATNSDTAVAQQSNANTDTGVTTSTKMIQSSTPGVQEATDLVKSQTPTVRSLVVEPMDQQVTTRGSQGVTNGSDSPAHQQVTTVQSLAASSGATDKTAMTEPTQIRQFIVETPKPLQVPGQVRVRIDPPDLGFIRIDLTSTGNGIVGTMRIRSEHTRDVVERNIGELHKSLAEAGVRVERFEIAGASRSDARQAFNPNTPNPNDGGNPWLRYQSQQQSGSSHQEQHHDARSGLVGHRDVTFELPEMSQTGRTALGRLDLVA